MGMALAWDAEFGLSAAGAEPEADAIVPFDISVVGLFGQADTDEYAQTADPPFLDS